jgi:hypothetical protein
VAQPATRGVLDTSVAGFVLGKAPARQKRRAVHKLTAVEAHLAGMLILPPGYDLVFDADAMLLCRADYSVAAAFSLGHVLAPAEVVRTAEEDHRLDTRTPPPFSPRNNGHLRHQPIG